jgi:hypothetical protein
MPPEKKNKKKSEKTSSRPEKISAGESLKRMKKFSERKEKMLADIRESQN